MYRVTFLSPLVYLGLFLGMRRTVLNSCMMFPQPLRGMSQDTGGWLSRRAAPVAPAAGAGLRVCVWCCVTLQAEEGG